MKTVEQIELEIRTRVRAEMKHFMKVEQFEPLPDDIWDELPPIVPVLQDYTRFSDYEDYYICNLQKED